MIPACIDVLTKFPTLPSGKVNRKELPAPKNLVVVNYDDDPDEAADDATGTGGGGGGGGADGALVPKNLDADPNYFPPRTPLEKKLAQMWRKLFQRPRVSSTDDFFTLGGHSLLAAWLVSALRKDAATEHVTMADVYGFPVLRDMACKLAGGDPSELPTAEEEAKSYLSSSVLSHASVQSNGGADDSRDDLLHDGDEDGFPMVEMNSDGSSATSKADQHRQQAIANLAPITNWDFIVCGFFQFIALYFLFALPALQIGIPWELYLKIRADGWQYIIIMLLPYSVAIFPIYVFLAICAKWILIGRYKEGKHPLWGWYYFRWWLVQRLVYYIPLVYLRGSPALAVYFRLMGAKIGKNVFLNTHLIEAPDLVEIGDDTSIGIDAQVINFHVEGGWLFIRRVVIGKCTYVGARSVVSGGSIICDHGQLGAMSLLTQGSRLPPWEHWRGSPAVKTARVENFMPAHMAEAVGAFAPAESSSMNGELPSTVSRRQQDSLYDAGHDDGASQTRSKFFADGGDLSEHLLSSRSPADAAVYIGVGEESIAWQVARPTLMSRFMLGLGQTCVLTLLLPCMALIALCPGLLLLHHLMPSDPNIADLRYQWSATWQFVATAGPMALSFFILLAWQITIIKWVLIGQIQPGDYKIHSWFYLRKWTVDLLMQVSIQVLHPMYSTMFLIPWFRSLGAIIGERCEIATTVYAAPDMINVGDECFLADTVYLGVPAVHQGIIRMGKISLGDRVFVGNGACLPMQTRIGNHCLVGVMSAPPLAHPLGDASAVMHWPEPALRSENGTAWLGNPAMYLPRRQAPHGFFDESVLYRPSAILVIMRLIMDFLKMTLPLTIYLVAMLTLVGDFEIVHGRFNHSWQFWLIFPSLYMAAGVGCCFIVLMLKWLLIGKYIAGEHPLWSTFIWRHDLITALLDSLVHPYFINILRGTPFVAMWFRLLGAEIGSRVWMDTTGITEPDLVHIGDDCAIHNDAQIQTHLYEDRILKMSHSYQGNKCSIGNSAVVLYDSLMHEGSHLLPLSLLMKGESLPAWTSWQGVPAHQTHSIGSDAPTHMNEVTTEELAGN